MSRLPFLSWLQAGGPRPSGSQSALLMGLRPTSSISLNMSLAGYDICQYYDHSTCMSYDHSICGYYNHSTCIVHACLVFIVRACTMFIVHSCAVIIVHVCTMIIVHVGTMIIVHFDHSTCMYYNHSACAYYDHSTCMYCYDFQGVELSGPQIVHLQGLKFSVPKKVYASKSFSFQV